MCKYYGLLRSVICHTKIAQRPTIVCRACALTKIVTTAHLACIRYVAYTLIHQNTFQQRWNEMQTAVTPVPPIQIHQYLHNPTPVDGTDSPPQRHSRKVLSPILTRHSNQPVIDLPPTQHTIM